ncbi:hypothetical protein FF36_05635 [Frankia torreyi]|uniref:Uncharacterized protein n=1 Tax=Frankia torreyi TaxID=1856 RepID=A0A0D8B7C4_9ACTN|nr:hypothetical protein FF36_05635 [Frankia torreyi]
MSAGASQPANSRARRRYWVWVARPEVSLDEDGSDHRERDPDRVTEPGEWWTCHAETQPGDLTLLYRSQLKKDRAYLIEAKSAAYSLADDESAAAEGWGVGCDYQVIDRFAQPLSIADMRLGMENSAHTLAIVSNNYLRSAYATTE